MLGEDEEDGEVDLEDIETRLYSQVYHSVKSDTDIVVNPIHLQETSTPIRQKCRRYFQMKSFPTKSSETSPNNPATISKQSPTNSKTNDGLNNSSLISNISENLNTSSESVISSISINRSPFSKSNINLNDSKSINKKMDNIIAQYSNTIIESGTKGDGSKLSKRAARNRLRFELFKLRKALGNVLTKKNSTEDPGTVVKNTNNSEIMNKSNNTVQENEIVCVISDESDSDCVEIINDDNHEDKKPIIVLSEIKSENDNMKEEELDELNTFGDDVILIENEPPEIINLDEESFQSSTPIKEKPSTSLQNNEKLNNEDLVNDENDTTAQKEQSPSSTLNDFIENPDIELNEYNFNFSLHGQEFQGDFLKPTRTNPAATDTCETASSSSTTELQTVKPIVFNEVEFPKDDIFSEPNLESFGEFITLNRSKTDKTTTNLSEPRESVKRKIYESDSSSESDFEEEASANILNNRKNLPDLSVMPIPEEENSRLSIENSADKKVENDSVSTEITDNTIYSDNKKRRSDPSDNLENKKQKLNDGIQENSDQKTTNEISNKNDLIGSMEDETASNDSVIIIDDSSPEKSIPNITRCDNLTPTKKSFHKDKSNLNKTREITSTNLSDTDKFDDLIIIDETVDDELEGVNVSTNTNMGLYVSNEQVSSSNVNRRSDLLKSFDSVGNDPILTHSRKFNIDHTIDRPLNEFLRELEKFDVEKIQRGMSDDPSLWEIIHLDKINFQMNVPGPRCNRCKEKGHKAVKCPNKSLLPKCSLCGFDGHLAPRCPIKLCTQCGISGNFLTNYCRTCYMYRHRICDICKMPGHSIKNCPDLWRRYYLTTEVGPPIKSEITTTPKEKIWCSGCGRFGHLVHTCRNSNTVYSQSSPFIFSYADINSVEYKQYLNGVYTNTEEALDVFKEPAQDNINFSNNLPNFISLDSNKSRKKIKQRMQLRSDNLVLKSGQLKPERIRNKRRHLFLKQGEQNIKQFLKKELNLIKSVECKKYIKKLKMLMNTRKGASKSMDYRKINMLLFGVYEIDTGTHIEILKKFQNHQGVQLMNKKNRKSLYQTYQYVFGSKKNTGVNYKEIINNIVV